ncbi:MAG: T9SS type A sorting domain-containing protein, partial [Chitinophagales bacterium]
VIYHDIDPDDTLKAVIHFPGDTYSIDLNNDGIYDFKFFAFKGAAYTGIDLAMNYSVSNTNALIGSLGTFNSNPVLRISVLASNQTIDVNQNLFSLSQLLFSGNQFFLPPMLTVYSSGDPNGQWTGGVVDHYVGLRFTDGTNTYYGWIRCDIPADASMVIIKDFAYNSTPNEGLFAGQGNPLGINEISNSSFGIFGYEGVANVMINDGNLDNTIVTVTNMMGQRVIDQPLTDKITRIDLNQFGKGLYVVTIQRGAEQYSKKVSFR